MFQAGEQLVGRPRGQREYTEPQEAPAEWGEIKSEKSKESRSKCSNVHCGIYKPVNPKRHNEAMRGLKNPHTHTAINAN